MNYHRVYKSNTSGEQEQSTLPEHLSARPDFSMINVTRSSVEDFRGHPTDGMLPVYTSAKTILQIISKTISSITHC
jgi:hypothetical protein